MKKRLFQVFDEMNVKDEKNKTALLPCAFTMVDAKTDKRGGLVTMGVEAEIIHKLFLNECQAVLVIFDKKEYHRLEAIPLDDKLQAAEAKAERYEKALKEIENWDVHDEKHYKEIATEALTHKTTTNE